MDLTTDKKSKKTVLQRTTEAQFEPQPVAQIYDKVEAPQASLEEEAELFVSRHRGLTLQIMTEVAHQPGYYVQTNVVFRDGKYRTGDAAIIGALKKQPNFGGTYTKKFSDRPSNARESLYYAGNLPDEIQAIERQESEQLTRDKTQYEDPYQVRS